MHQTLFSIRSLSQKITKNCFATANLLQRTQHARRCRGGRLSNASLPARMTQNFSSTSTPKNDVLKLPSLKSDMQSALQIRQRARAGEKLSAGDVVCDVELDNMTVEFKMPTDGVVQRWLVGDAAQEVAVGTPLVEIGEVGSHNYSQQIHGNGHNFKLMPSAWRLAHEHGVRVSDVTGTGKGGRITKGDILVHIGKVDKGHLDRISKRTVLSHASNSSTSTERRPPSRAHTPDAIHEEAGQPAHPQSTHKQVPSSFESSFVSSTLPARPIRGSYEDVRASGMRRVIADRLTESKSSNPHTYAIIDCRLDALLKLRKQLKESGINVSVNDVIIKASALALRDVPQANCGFDEATKSIKSHDSIDICVAVATEGGLITPIVKDTDKIGLVQINTMVKDLATRARTGKLRSEEYQGGSFTISNLGMFGIDEFTAVINPPHSCILAVGQGKSQLAFQEDQEEPQLVNVMSVQLSADRRVVDEITTGLFLQAFQRYIEQPQLMLV